MGNDLSHDDESRFSECKAGWKKSQAAGGRILCPLFFMIHMYDETGEKALYTEILRKHIKEFMKKHVMEKKEGEQLWIQTISTFD